MSRKYCPRAVRLAITVAERSQPVGALTTSSTRWYVVAGVYDDAVSKLEQLSAAVNRYLDSDRWKAQGARVSAALSGMLDSAAGSLKAFLRAATGADGADSW